MSNQAIHHTVQDATAIGRSEAPAILHRREFLAAGVAAAASLVLTPVPSPGGRPSQGVRIPQKPLDLEDLAPREDLAG